MGLYLEYRMSGMDKIEVRTYDCHPLMYRIVFLHQEETQPGLLEDAHSPGLLYPTAILRNPGVL